MADDNAPYIDRWPSSDWPKRRGARKTKVDKAVADAAQPAKDTPKQN